MPAAGMEWKQNLVILTAVYPTQPKYCIQYIEQRVIFDGPLFSFLF